MSKVGWVSFPQSILFSSTDPNPQSLLLAQSFDPFGNVLEQGGSGSSGFGYTSEQVDGTELVYLRTRYYDPRVGRFLTADSIVPDPMRSGGWNRYAYVGNNPIRYTDPSGHCWGPMSFLRSVPYYDTTCDNLDMAIFIAGHPNATRYQKAQVVSYVEAIAVSHIVLAEALVIGGYGALLETGLIGGEAYDASQQCHEPPGEGTSPSYDDPMPVPTPGTQGNTNPFDGSVDTDVIVVDSKGNAIPVKEGEQLTGSPDSRWIQVRDVEGHPTGVRLDGPHKPTTHPDPRAQVPHGHIPDKTNEEGTPWLPVKQ